MIAMVGVFAAIKINIISLIHIVFVLGGVVIIFGWFILHHHVYWPTIAFVAFTLIDWVLQRIGQATKDKWIKRVEYLSFVFLIISFIIIL